nr:uncharacterized mitochondrial protein AtMg00810-like [Tanacetum cinerariifolium]
MLDSQVNEKNKTGVGYHAVPPPYTANFMSHKPDLILADMDEYVVSESVTSMSAVATNEAKTSESKPKSVSEPLIEDWVSDSEDENVTETKSKQRKPSFSKLELQEKGVIDSGCSMYMTGNMSYLSEYEEINDGYVAFGGDPKGGKITEVKNASTPIETQKPLLKDEDGEEVDVYMYRSMIGSLMYRSMIGSLMYLTSLRPDIMFAKQKTRKTNRKDNELPQTSVPTENVVDEAVNEEIDDSLERAATTATSLDAEQDRGNINKTQSRATPNELSFIGTSSGGGPKRQDTMRDTIAQTRVFDLENTKTSQAQEIISFKKRVRLEKKKRSRTHRLKRLYKVGLSAKVKSSDDNEESLEPEMPMKKKDQISLDEELTFKLQAKEERIAREKAQQVKEVNLAWDDVQAKIEADYELAQRLQAEEQEQ